MTRYPRLALIITALLATLTGCAPPRHAAPAGDTRFIVVRHAEKQTGEGAHADDPELTEAGHQRARRLAHALDGAGIVAVYSTPYRRTRDTASPTARANGLDIIEYDPRQPATDFANTLRASHAANTVLVVGHSNTVPGIVAALCECEVAQMGEDEYDHRFIIDIDAAGEARMSDEPLP